MFLHIAQKISWLLLPFVENEVVSEKDPDVKKEIDTKHQQDDPFIEDNTASTFASEEDSITDTPKVTLNDDIETSKRLQVQSPKTQFRRSKIPKVVKKLQNKQDIGPKDSPATSIVSTKKEKDFMRPSRIPRLFRKSSNKRKVHSMEEPAIICAKEITSLSTSITTKDGDIDDKEVSQIKTQKSPKRVSRTHKTPQNSSNRRNRKKNLKCG